MIESNNNGADSEVWLNGGKERKKADGKCMKTSLDVGIVLK